MGDLPKWLEKRSGIVFGISLHVALDKEDAEKLSRLIMTWQEERNLFLAHIKECRAMIAAQHACVSFLSVNAGKCDGCNIEPCADIAAQELLNRKEPPEVKKHYALIENGQAFIPAEEASDDGR